MKLLKHLILLSILLCIISCTKNDRDKVELSYSFEKKEKKINLMLHNNTNENFLVIMPKAFNFDGKQSGSEKLEENKPVNAYLINQEQTVFSKQIDSIHSFLSPGASSNDIKTLFPTAVFIKKKSTKQLEYKFNNNFILNKEYKTSFGKMRDILNTPYNLEMVQKMLECRKDGQYKIYLDDFVIKDSIKVKF